MEEETTTPAPVDTGVETTQPVEAVNTEAVITPAVATEEQTTETTEPSDDEQLNKWAESKGLELDSDNAKKAAKMAREAEKAMHSKAQKASELEKAAAAVSDADAVQVAEATGQDPELLKRLQAVETKERVRDFWSQDDIDRSYEPAMIDLLKTKPYLAGDLDALYATAVMKSGGVAAVKSQGKREALESLAHKQQAAVPTGSATTSGQPKKKEFKDLSIKEMENKLGFAPR
jgi:plasmid maintenance system antidote protein VapI